MDADSGPSARTLLFDGDCGFCTTAAKRAGRISPATSVIAWQHADLDQLGITATDAAAALQYVGPRHRATGADAIGLFLVDTGGPYAVLGRLLLLPGIRSVARFAYRWVANHRSRLPGGTPACATEPAAPI